MQPHENTQANLLQTTRNSVGTILMMSRAILDTQTQNLQTRQKSQLFAYVKMQVIKIDVEHTY